MVRYIGIMLSALISSCDAKSLLGWSLSDKTYFWRECEKSSQSWNTNNTHTHMWMCCLPDVWKTHSREEEEECVEVCDEMPGSHSCLSVCCQTEFSSVQWFGPAGSQRDACPAAVLQSMMVQKKKKKCAIGCTLTNSKDKEHFVSIFISESIHMETNQSDTILTRGRTMYRLNALLKVKLASQICVKATIAKSSLLLQ